MAAAKRWPALVKASEGGTIQFQAESAAGSRQQSIRYLNRLPVPVSLPREQVESALDAFIASVLDRLEAWDPLLEQELARSYPNTSREWVLPQQNHWHDRECGTQGPDHLDPSVVQKAASGHTYRHFLRPTS
jgi:hypothetical protein